ncbi:coadhesin-like [Xenia sp. Carnegie-2017]|uniref:coadhesin-like n=1 Tax=Xenia sp. Carnegie-2017 TaxID=2897299 RepID=UPI001F041501|nr:coadhesin-like [Xenia sp. Carnegie-2017]
MATQGRGREAFNHWVKEYYVSYREGESGLWIPFIKSGETQALMFTGNSDPFTVVYHAFNRSIQARYFRFHPVEWNVQICMRVELYGCLVLTGEEDIVIDDDDLLIIFIVLLVISAIFTILVLVLLLTMRKLLKRMERKLIESRTGLSLRDSVDGKKSSYEKPVYTTIIKSKQKSSERKSTNTNDSNSPRMKEQGTQRNKIETLDL